LVVKIFQSVTLKKKGKNEKIITKGSKRGGKILGKSQKNDKFKNHSLPVCVILGQKTKNTNRKKGGWGGFITQIGWGKKYQKQKGGGSMKNQTGDKIKLGIGQ